MSVRIRVFVSSLVTPENMFFNLWKIISWTLQIFRPICFQLVMDMVSEWILFVTMEPCDLLEMGIKGCKTFIMYQGQVVNKKTCHSWKAFSHSEWIQFNYKGRNNCENSGNHDSSWASDTPEWRNDRWNFEDRKICIAQCVWQMEKHRFFFFCNFHFTVKNLKTINYEEVTRAGSGSVTINSPEFKEFPFSLYI